MDLARWQKIAAIVDQALVLETPSERTSFIDECCDNDPKLKREVTQWLNSISESEGLWNELLLSNQVLMDDMTLTGSFSMPDPTNAIPEIIGPYTIKECIGRGGMGNVYLAKRTKGDFHEAVAIKVIRNKEISSNQLQRFLQERSMLSRLNHPNISRLLDGGLSGDERPYYVMEYVDGIPITEYCKKYNCSFNARLNLFEQVCKAVQYAHSNFIVHRDLKPDNLLVTPGGTVKVLDFGIAKLLNQEMNEKSLLQTRVGQRLLSLNYAAPEQVTMEATTTATDVYALGLLLYELLSGCRPLNLKNKKLLEAEQIIRNEEPEKPSTVASVFRDNLRGDLDAIILKTLRKEPDQRYESASRLLDDIENYRHNRPVLARKGNLQYRVGKFVKRNKTMLTAGILFLIGAIAFGIYHIYKVNNEREIAQFETDKAKQATAFMVDLFDSSDPTQNIGDTLNVYDLLKQGKDRVDQLNQQPKLQASILLALGEAHLRTGEYEEAGNLLKKADSLTNVHYSKNSFEVANAALTLGLLQATQRNYNFAREYYQKAERIFRNLPDKYWLKKAYTLTGYGYTMTGLNKPDSAEIFIKQGLELQVKHQADNKEVISTKLKLAQSYRGQNKYTEAEKIYRDILRDFQKSDSVEVNLRLVTFNNLAFLLRKQDRYNEAEQYYKKALAGHSEVYGEDHPTTLMILSNLAKVVHLQNKINETAALLKQNYQLTEQRYGTHWRTGTAVKSLGNFYFVNQDFESAERYFNEAFEIYSKTIGENHLWTGRPLLMSYFSQKNISPNSVKDSLFNKGYTILQNNSVNFTPNDVNLLNQLIERADTSSRVDCSVEINQLRQLLATVD